MATSTNVSAAKPKTGGAIYVCDASSATLPTTASGTLSGFTCLGYVSEDGLTNSNSPATDFIKAWGGDPVLPIIEDREDTFNFQLIEVLNSDVLAIVYGDDNVTTNDSGDTVISVNSDELPAKAYVIDMIMRDSAIKRIVIPSAYVTELGDITYSDSDAVAYDVTIQAQADSSGNTHYEYIAI